MGIGPFRVGEDMQVGHIQAVDEIKSFFESVKDDPDANEIKEILIYMLSFLWASVRRIMVHMPYKILSNGEILLWADCLHLHNVRSSSML